MAKNKKMPPEQRALWTFLLATLVGPALGAVAALLVSLGASLVGRGGGAGLDAAQRLAWAAERALSSYVWAAIPAGLAGAVLAGLVWRTGGFSWLVAAITGAVAVTLMAGVSSAVVVGGQTTLAAFVGASAGVAIWELARRLKLIRTP